MIHSAYLEVTRAIDFDHPQIQKFVESHTSPTMSQIDTAISLYYAVRDSIRYNPYKVDLTLYGMKASTTLKNEYGWCVPKAVLLAACCRLRGIPARLGFGDVRNHMSTRRMREWMKTDVFFWHGFTDIYVHDRWVKATPAFNRELCEKLGIAPLDFNGLDDSILHSSDRAGNTYMEYLHDRGRFDDLPLAEIIATFKEKYSAMLGQGNVDFDMDIIEEVHR